jgi:Ala-tRNA(Pro) deacylase
MLTRRGRQAVRIADFLAGSQVPFEALQHPPAFTAQKRASYLRIKGKQVAKAVLLHGPAGPCLAVLPATHHVDLTLLAEHLGGRVRVASEQEAARLFRDCEWGVVPPFGNLYGVPVLLDDSLTPDMVVVLETHTHVEAVRLSVRDFERLARPSRLLFAHKIDSSPAAGNEEPKADGGRRRPTL